MTERGMTERGMTERNATSIFESAALLTTVGCRDTIETAPERVFPPIASPPHRDAP